MIMRIECCRVYDENMPSLRLDHLDLTPLEPDEWHALVAYNRIMNGCADKGTKYPDNKELDFEDSQPRELHYLWPYLGQDFKKRFEGKYYTSKC